MSEDIAVRNNSSRFHDSVMHLRCQRKKEQNKLASKRFRERKKLEMERAKTEIAELEVRNDLLRKKESCMLAEIENLKKVLLELNLIKIVQLPTGVTTIVVNNN